MNQRFCEEAQSDGQFKIYDRGRLILLVIDELHFPALSSLFIFERGKRFSSVIEEEFTPLKQVGLYSNHSYARSLARFAATLRSVAWKIASMRIEQALPQGIKLGRGWVGEYDPLPSAFVLEKEPIFFAFNSGIWFGFMRFKGAVI
ncbi:hypothetical protein ACS0TY_002379 [Phlomoides rotata]